MDAQSGGRVRISSSQAGLTHKVKVIFVRALSKTSLQIVQIVRADLSAEVCQVTAIFPRSDTNVFIRREL